MAFTATGALYAVYLWSGSYDGMLCQPTRAMSSKGFKSFRSCGRHLFSQVVIHSPTFVTIDPCQRNSTKGFA